MFDLTANNESYLPEMLAAALEVCPCQGCLALSGAQTFFILNKRAIIKIVERLTAQVFFVHYDIWPGLDPPSDH